MKPIIFIFAIFTLALYSCSDIACSCLSWEEPSPPTSFNTTYKGIPFRGGYNFDNVLFIKVLVLDSYGGYGRRMEVIADLKGNFPEETTTFIVWGKATEKESFSYYGGALHRVDDLSLYNNQDTLLMLSYPVTWDDWSRTEKRGDYATFTYAYSILKLSNDSVRGYITSCYKGEETMPMEEFQELLNSIKETNL